ncbi:acyltransferase [Isoptericola variabilis]|uniref:Acyltransferase 3 n=1 Tax=Isoptericola variabilis (strain 225) TaxID=743718 RepID=F6FRM6_ISOV2|nr:acyltransferase [Isoptericola variabilis]AEG45084.1 acyltransferase 3 [Isoptericola variabilis 225]TWH26214.1 peptidoglycan/LPS O-acetylase OafA/YrhL [Isoptericola variabilis J7]
MAETTPLTQTPPARPAQRLLAVDGLRFLAAAAVMLYHFTATSTVTRYWGGTPGADLFPVLNHVTRYGWLAVELFFVISGFFILMTAQGRSLAHFTGSRVGRLFPAYWACIVITALLHAVWSGGRQLTFGETLLNLTMVQELFGVQSSQVVFWTLLAELKFYLLVAVLLAFGPMTRLKVLGLATLWPLAGMLARAAGQYELGEVLVARYAPYFAVGMLLFLLRRDGVRGNGAVLAVLGGNLALCCHLVIVATGHATTLQGVPVNPVVALALMLLCVVAVWVASSPRVEARGRVTVALCTAGGLLTYPVYLVHSEFGYATIEALASRGVGPWVTLAAAVAVTGALSWAIYRFVEERWSRRLRHAVVRAMTPTAGERVPQRRAATSSA